jgi:hypothetical protein
LLLSVIASKERKEKKERKKERKGKEEKKESKERKEGRRKGKKKMVRVSGEMGGGSLRERNRSSKRG